MGKWHVRPVYLKPYSHSKTVQCAAGRNIATDKIKVIGGDNVNVEYTSGFDILEIKTNEEIENNHTKLMGKAKDLLSE